MHFVHAVWMDDGWMGWFLQVVYGTAGSLSRGDIAARLRAATYLANDLYYQGRYAVRILSDTAAMRNISGYVRL